MAKKEAKKTPRLVLLDVHAILHRGYHALPDFTSNSGEPTGALYGLAAMLIKTARELEPDYFAACYDLPEPTFRSEQFADYKAGRAAPDEALISQIERSREIFEAFGIPVYEAAGFEADDLIGTISEKCAYETLETVIASGDMDTLQLVDDEAGVRVYTLRKGLSDTVFYDRATVEGRFGFGPEYLPDFKGLSGDKSDNIPGISGIGEKSATELIQKFGTVEEIFSALGKDRGQFEKKGIKSRVVNLLDGHEEEALFSKELGTIRRDAPIDFSLPSQNFRKGLEPEKVRACFEKFEFQSLVQRFEALTGAETKVENESEDESAKTPTEDDIDPDRLKEAKIALWLLDSEKTTPTLEDIWQYSGVKNFEKAQKFLEQKINKKGLERIYQLECAIIPIVAAAESRGILVDTDYFKRLSKDYHRKLASHEKKIWKLAGVEFNVNSPKQLGEVLFESMQIPTKGLKKTAGGAISTRESQLEKLADEHEIADEILAYRELQKLLSTYIDVIPTMVDETARLHTSLNQTGTTTGRMSSTNPNLQNIPVREGLGEAVRGGFLAPKGSLLAAFDYSQIEMRVLAELSGDEHLLETFREGRDVHSSVASRVFGVSEDAVSKDQRRAAKVINFGIVYGMGVRALKQNLGGSMAEAQEFYNSYFAEFPKISQYFDRVKKRARERGYTETLFGRRRYLPEITSSAPHIRAGAERMAINAPVQGTATGDIVKMAMRDVDAALSKEHLQEHVHLLVQVHDELIFEISEKAREKALPLIQKTMEATGGLSVPLEVGVKVGPNWGELQSVNVS